MQTIGLDIAKSVFQVYGVGAGGQVMVRRQLKRRYVLTFFGLTMSVDWGRPEVAGRGSKRRD